MRDPVSAAVIKSAVTPEEFKTLQAYLQNLAEDDSSDLVEVARAVLNFSSEGGTQTSNWEEIKSPTRREYAEAKTKKEWEKIDKKELDRDTKKEKEDHEKDAVKDGRL